VSDWQRLKIGQYLVIGKAIFSSKNSHIATMSGIAYRKGGDRRRLRRSSPTLAVLSATSFRS
jgi:hypothetical protein